MEETSDADLVVLARSGDADAFRVLLSRYRAMARSVALHLSGDREAAEDLVQGATLAAFVSLGRLRDPNRFRSWFYGTVVNVTRAWRRRQAGQPVVWVTRRPGRCGQPVGSGNSKCWTRATRTASSR